jgi:S1-C subfamily serine protease
MEIWIHRDGQFAGRFSESVIREKIADGSLSASDLAWNEAKSSWQPISELLASSAVSASAPAESDSSKSATEPPADAEPKAATPRPMPPPLPASMPVPAAGPPPLPAMTSPAMSATPVAQLGSSQPPLGETIWSPWMAILGSIFLSPAFGGFLVWRNWLTMKRRRRAMVAAPWFWLGFGIIGLVFYSRSTVALLIWVAYLAAWIAFSAYPQIRYIDTTYKKEKTRWGLPLVAALILWGIGFTVFQIVTPDTKPTLAPSPEQPSTTQLSASQSHDRVFTAEELRDIYKSSVLEVRATWKEKKSSFNKKENGANGTGVLLYNDAEYGLVATNWHVVEPSDSMTGDYKCGVRFSHDKDFADCLVVARAKNEVDLALLLVRLEGKWTPNQFPVRPLDNIKEGEACIAIGNALGEGLSITGGIISRFDKVKDQTLIRTSTPVSPGNSGGPLILCRGGALAGIVTLQSRITNVQNVNFATPAQLILDKDIWDFEPDQPQAQQLLEKAIAQAPKK